MADQTTNRKEIEEMFNVSFLPEIQKFGERSLELNKEHDIKMFYVTLQFNFYPQEKPLTFADIENTVNMQIQPVTKEDFDKWKKENEASKETFEKVQ